MSISVADFWKLLVDSRLATAADCQQWSDSFARVPGSGGDATTLANYLVASGAISRYHARLLLAGRPGPFMYGEHKIIERIESGRLSGLFRAVHLTTGHPVLLNFFAGRAIQDASLWATIARQGNTAIGLVHRHICRVYELVDLLSYKLAVLEDLEGGSLAERSTAALPAADACRMVSQIAQGLSHLHESGQAHGDIRPANIWVDPAGAAKLLCFPIARDPLAQGRLDFSPQGVARLQAAADYSAPELAQPGRAPDPLSDVYSLGCTLYELLAGRVPFAGGDTAGKLHRHAIEAIEPLDRIAGVPAPLAKAVAYMMAKNTKVRTASAAAVVEALVPYVGPEMSAPPPVSATTLAAYEAKFRQPQRAAERSRSTPAAAKSPVASPPRKDSDSFPPGDRRTADSPGGRNLNPVAASPAPVSPATVSAGAVSSGTVSQAAVSQKNVPQSTAAAPVVVERTPATFGAISLVSAPGASAQRLRKQKQSSSAMVAMGVVGALAVAVLIAVLASKGPADKPQPVASNPPEKQQPVKPSPSKPSLPKPAPVKHDTPPESDPATEQPIEKPKKQRQLTPSPVEPAITEIDDDGETMWASPTAGEPIDLKFVPAGSQVFMHLRPADLLESPEGEKVLFSLGPAAASTRGQIETILGVPLTNVQQLLISFYSLEAGPPQMAMVVRLREKLAADELAAKWKASPAGEGDAKYFQAGSWGYYIPRGDESVFVVAAPAALKEVIESPEPPLRREMEKLLRDTDSQRHFTLLVAPHYLLSGDGQALLAGNLDKLRGPLTWFFGDNVVQAAMLSLHFGDDFFAEMRIYGTLDHDPYQLAKQFREKLGKVPEQIEAYVVFLRPQPYGNFILRRFPDMIQRLQEFTRVEAENKQAVLRCYLPGPAGHNLLMGSELVLSERPGATGAAATTQGPKKPAGVAEALQQKISMSFDKDTLEKCMELIGKEIDVEIVIVGADLQLDGITKNQSFGLNERDKPAAEILKTVMQKANPDGKLIYVIKPKQPGGKEALFITTRTQAEKRGDPIPPELKK